MANKLSDLQVKEVSLVKQGAIGEVFTIIKSADPDPEPTTVEKTGLLAEIKKALTVFFGKVTKKKSFTSFTEAMSEKELKNSFYDAFWVLEDIVWNIFNDDLIIDKVGAVGQAINDFRDYVIADLGVDISKMKEVIKSHREEKQKVEKVGKKINSSNLSQLKNVLDIVNTIVNEAETAPQTTVMDGGADGVSKSKQGGEEMTPEEITKAFETALAPVITSITGLADKVAKLEGLKKETTPAATEPAATEPAATEPVGKSEITPDQITEIIGKAVGPIAKSIEGISERVEKLEKTPLPSNAITPGAAQVEKKVKWPTFGGSK